MCVCSIDSKVKKQKTKKSQGIQEGKTNKKQKKSESDLITDRDVLDDYPSITLVVSKFFNKKEFADFELVVVSQNGENTLGTVFYLSRHFISQMISDDEKHSPMMEWIRDDSTTTLLVEDFKPDVYEFVLRLYLNPTQPGEIFFVFFLNRIKNLQFVTSFFFESNCCFLKSCMCVFLYVFVFFKGFIELNKFHHAADENEKELFYETLPLCHKYSLTVLNNVLGTRFERVTDTMDDVESCFDSKFVGAAKTILNR